MVVDRCHFVRQSLADLLFDIEYHLDFSLHGICVYSNVLFYARLLKDFIKRAKTKPHKPLSFSITLSNFLVVERVRGWTATNFVM